MKTFAVIGRNAPGKGFELIQETFSKYNSLNCTLCVFTDIPLRLSSQADFTVIHYGWLDSRDVWAQHFDYVILPMDGPETSCLVLHECARNMKRAIFRRFNESITSQVASKIYDFANPEELYSLVLNIVTNSIDIPRVQLKTNRRSLWDRIK